MRNHRASTTETYFSKLTYTLKYVGTSRRTKKNIIFLNFIVNDVCEISIIQKFIFIQFIFDIDVLAQPIKEGLVLIRISVEFWLQNKNISLIEERN